MAFVPVCAAGVSSSAFGGVAVSRRDAQVLVAPARRGALVMMAGNREENRARREAIVESVKLQLTESDMVLAAEMEGISVTKMNELKNMLPESTKLMAVKNTLLRIAVDDDEKWGPLSDFSSGSNMWFFIKDDVKGTVEGFKKFLKENKREVGVKGGVLEGLTYDPAGVETVSKLPSKQELYQKIAVSIKAVPTKVGKGVKAVPSKLGRAIKLAIATEPDESA